MASKRGDKSAQFGTFCVQKKISDGRSNIVDGERPADNDSFVVVYPATGTTTKSACEQYLRDHCQYINNPPTTPWWKC